LERRRLPGWYDFARLQAFHRCILGDVYGWAGHPTKKGSKDTSGRPVSRAGFGYAAYWAVVFAGRLVFIYGTYHWFSRQLGQFLAAHQLSATGLSNALVFMVVAMALARSALLGVRGRAARRAVAGPMAPAAPGYPSDAAGHRTPAGRSWDRPGCRASARRRRLRCAWNPMTFHPRRSLRPGCRYIRAQGCDSEEGRRVTVGYQKIRAENIARQAGTPPCWTCSASYTASAPASRLGITHTTASRRSLAPRMNSIEHGRHACLVDRFSFTIALIAH
jgi:hypothetical protein